MFQQLLNTTAIWLLCLLAYDIFLGKETYHRYNRIYLLAALLLGAILPALPAINWQSETVVYQTPLSISLQQVASVKESIETTVVPEPPEFNTSLILVFLYLIGCVFSMAMIIREMLLIARMYDRGLRHKEGKWTVIETNEAHGPFSFFNYIFVGNKKLYDEREWNILLAHEGKHIEQQHFIDVVIIQLARILFWFHPLVYLFQRRILMIHEYQADTVGAERPSEYGAFLIEQAMLQATPSITHSFNRSPIKKRIFMLTKKSSKTKMLKALVAIPVAVCCMFCFSKSAYSYKKGEGNTIVFKGNKFEFSGPGAGNNGKGVEMQVKSDADPTPITVSFFAAPVKMNDTKIHSAGEVTKEPVFLGKDKTLTQYLFNSVQQELNKLEDGEYFIHIPYPVVDEKGKLVYYELQGITASGQGKIIARSTKESIDNKLADALDNAPKFKPAEVKGKAVPWYDAWAVELGYRIMVKNHKATLSYKEPH